MDDQQKSRLVVIVLAGGLLLGGGAWWMMTQNNAAEKADTQANNSIAQPPTPAPDAAATTPAATTPAATPAAATPASTAGLTSLAGAAPDASATPAAATPATPTTIASSELPATGLTAAQTSTAPAASSDGLAPAPAGSYPATKRDAAVASAKQVAGREDPMKGSFDRTPYPAPWTKTGQAGGRTTADDEADEREKAEKAADKAGGGHKYARGQTEVPPPPPPSKEKPVPPPPPSAVAEAPSLPIDNLPQPPDKPLVTPSLKLTAILGNKAVLAVPLTMRQQNKWPAVICLGPGERFEDPANGSFSVVSVEPDSVTIEEESERSVKSLPQIK